VRIFTLLLATALVLPLAGCGRPPQITHNEESMKATDALWTAVRSKRLELLAQVETELQRLHQENKLDDDAFNDLEKIIEVARAGNWDKATKNLRWFIKGQRRV
jgi:hypothetical protein